MHHRQKYKSLNMMTFEYWKRKKESDFAFTFAEEKCTSINWRRTGIKGKSVTHIMAYF
jgi:hypothetical protein